MLHTQTILRNACFVFSSEKNRREIKITLDNKQSFCFIDVEREVDRMPPQALSHWGEDSDFEAECLRQP